MTPLSRNPSDNPLVEPKPAMSMAVSIGTGSPLDENEFLKYLDSLKVTPSTHNQNDFIVTTFASPKADYVIERATELGPITSAKMSFTANQPIDITGIKACARLFTEPIVSLQLIAGKNDDLIKLELAIEGFASNPNTSLKIDFNAQALAQGFSPERTEQLNAAVTALNDATSPTAAILAIAQIKKILSPEQTLEVDPEVQAAKEYAGKLAAVAGGIFQQASEIRAAKKAVAEALTEKTTAETEDGAAKQVSSQSMIELEAARALFKERDLKQQELDTITTAGGPLVEAVASTDAALASANEALERQRENVQSAHNAVMRCEEEIVRLTAEVTAKSSELSAATQRLAAVSALSAQYDARIAQLNEAIKALPSVIDEQKKQIFSNEETLRLYEAEITTLGERIDALESSNTSLSSQILESSSALSSLQKELEDAQQVESTTNRELQQLQATLKTLQAQITPAQQAFDESKVLRDAASLKETELNTALSEATQLYDKEKKEINRLGVIIDAQRLLVKDLSEELEEITTQIDSATDKETTLSAQMTQAQEQRDNSAKSVAALQESVGELTSTLGQAEAERDRCRREAEVAIGEVLSTQKQFLAAFTGLDTNVSLIAPEGSPLHSQIKNIISNVAEIAVMNSATLNATDTEAQSARAESLQALNQTLSNLSSLVANEKQSFIQTMLQAFGLSKRAESQDNIKGKIQTFHQHCVSFIESGQELAGKIQSANMAQQSVIVATHNISKVETLHQAESQALQTAQSQLSAHQKTFDGLRAELLSTQQQLAAANSESYIASVLLSKANDTLASQTKLLESATRRSESAKTAIADYTQASQAASQQVRELSARCSSQEEHLLSIQDKISALRLQISPLETALASSPATKKSLSDKIETITPQLEGLHSALHGNSQTMSTLSEKMQDLVGSSSTLREQTALLGTALIETVQQLTQKKLVLTAANAFLHQGQPEITALQADIEVLKASINKLSEKKEALVTRQLPELEALKARAEADIAPLTEVVTEKTLLLEEAKRKLSEHEDRTARIQEHLETLESQCAAIKMPQLEENVATNTQLLAAAATRLSHAKEALKSKSALLAELQSAQPRGAQALQISEASLPSNTSNPPSVPNGVAAEQAPLPPPVPEVRSTNVKLTEPNSPPPPPPPQMATESSHTSVVTPPSHNANLVRSSLSVLQRGSAPTFKKPH